MEAATVVIDPRSIKIKQYRGVGVQWDPFTDYPLDDIQWEKLTARVDHLKPAFLRTMIYSNFYCLGFREDGSPIYDYDNAEYMQPLYRLLDYAESRRIPIVFGEWEPPVKFTGTSLGQVDVDDPRWARMIGDLLDHLIHTKGYSVIRYYNLVNEANQPWSLVADFEKWKAGILLLEQELRARKLDDRLQIVGPDSVWDPDWIEETVRQLHGTIGAYDIHIYADLEKVLDGTQEKIFAAKKDYASLMDPAGRDKDFLLTEAGMLTGKTDGDSQPNVKEFRYGVSMADLAAQSMRSGLSGIAIWDLDDAMHGQDNGYDRMDPRSLKMWGFWNSWGVKMGVPEEENIRPHYYTWSLMTHLFPPGSSIIASSESGLYGLRTVAMKLADGGREEWSVMVVNHSDSSRTVTVRMAEAADTMVRMFEFRYFEDDRRVDEDGYPLPSRWRDVNLSRGADLVLPSLGVVILSTLSTIK